MHPKTILIRWFLPTYLIFNHTYRVIVRDGGDEDVVECSRCGVQRVTRCNFDEEFS